MWEIHSLSLLETFKTYIMDLEKSQLDLLGNLLKSSLDTSTEIAEISGEDKTTVTLVTVGLTLLVTGLFRALNT